MTKEEHLKKIKEADKAYYESANPIMTDLEYDALRNNYISQYGSDDLNYVPGKTVTSRKFKHPIEVTSLAKVDGFDEEKFKSELQRLTPFVAEPKYDGITVVAYPKADGSYFFVTRGSGSEGDILPAFIYTDEDKGENTEYAIRGEAFMTQANFEKMNADLIKNGEAPKANPRNAAAGILNPARKETSKYLNLISYICYDVISMDKSETAKLNYIKSKTPFTPTPLLSFESFDCLLTDNCMTKIKEWHKFIIDEKTFPIDGMVVKYNEDNGLKKFGSTDHHPKNAVAIKAAQEVVMSTLRNVSWQLGKTGALTPVAEFDPIEILGSTVSKASLSNPDEIARLKLHIGDRIGVIKAREIIPKVVLNSGGGTKNIDTPTVCPSCKTKLVKVGPILQCQSGICDEKIAQKIAFMGSKKVLDVDGLSIQTARKIVGYVKKNMPDAYKKEDQNIWLTLSKHDIEKLEGFSTKSATNLFNAINEIVSGKKQIAFPRFLKACCVDGIGENVGKILETKYNSIQSLEAELLSKTTGMPLPDQEVANEFAKLDGIGMETAVVLVSSEFWEAVLNLHYHIKPVFATQKELAQSSAASNKTFVLTGKMPKKRSEYEAAIESAGGTVASSVSKNTDYLVIADVNSNSTKAQKARTLGTVLITPEQLEEMLNQK